MVQRGVIVLDFKKNSNTKFYLYLLAPLLITLIPSIAVSESFTCTITNTTDCASDHILLKLNSTDGSGFDNAHTELRNYSDPGYPYSICCNSTIQTLNLSCDALNAVEVLKLNNQTNSHVQFADDFGAGNYSYPVCISGQGSGSCVATYDSCPASYECVASISSSEDNSGSYNHTNAHLASCGYYALEICCLLEGLPDAPVLVYPVDDTTINRTPVFNWTFEGSSENVLFDFQLSELNDFSVNLIDETNINNLSLFSSNFLTELDFATHYWRVRAYDEDTGLYSEWNSSNFEVLSYVAIILLNPTMDFGLLEPGDEKNTTNNVPNPFRFRNVGNVELDLIKVNVSNSLWDLADLGSENWRMQSRSNADSFKINWSFLDWWNIENFTLESYMFKFISKLNYSGLDQNLDEADVDIGILVPLSEPPTEKTSSLTFTWRMHEEPWCNPDWGIVIPGASTTICWQKDVSTSLRTWSNSQSYCQGLDLGGRSWVAPTNNDWNGLINHIGSTSNYGSFLNNYYGFSGFANERYWTSTYFGQVSTRDGFVAHYYYRDLADGTSSTSSESTNYRVACVSYKD